ncbi:hypothetical protein BCD49_15495 [Pseudofrankia sp. EUN1h]|nr:hypothetical protein BCD49_15495 [Pseudofrankia sp. EUN1h]
MGGGAMGGGGRPAGPAAGRGRLAALFAFTAVVLRILTRDRLALFFLLVLPVAVITVIGAAFGGADRASVGLVRPGDGQVSQAVERALRDAPGLRVRGLASQDAATDAVRRGDVAAALVLPATLDADVLAGRSVRASVLTEATSGAGVTARLALEGVVSRATLPFAAARTVAAQAGGTVVARADALADVPPPLTVRVTDAGGGPAGASASRYSMFAAQNLVVFVFINAMASATLIVAARRQGVLRRALSTRTGLPSVLGGLGLGWFVLTLLQSVLILLTGTLLFGVRWGNPAAAALLVLSFAGVGCGAGLLVGAIGRDPDRVGSITPVVGIVLAALGGCMVPPEFFPPVMTTIAHATPHYWAVTAWESVLFDGAGVAGVATHLGVLAAAAVVLVSLAAGLLRRDLARG